MMHRLIFELRTPTFKENKTYRRHDNGYKGKSEKKSNRQCSQGAEQQHCQS